MNNLARAPKPNKITRPCMPEGLTLTLPTTCTSLPKMEFKPLTDEYASARSAEWHNVMTEEISTHTMEEEIASGWKFDPEKNSDAEALTCPNPVEMLTQHEHKWIQNLKLLRTKAETDQIHQIEAAGKGYTTWQDSLKSNDLLETSDDASFNEVVDTFYDNIETCSDPIKDEQQAESTALVSMAEKQMVVVENRFGQSFQDSGIYMEDGFAKEVGKVSATDLGFPTEQTTEDITAVNSGCKYDGDYEIPQCLDTDSNQVDERDNLGTDSSAAVCSQILGNLQALARSSKKTNQVRTQRTETPLLHEGDSSSDPLSSASPLKITPMSKRKQGFLATSGVTNLTPEYDSDSCTENGDSPCPTPPHLPANPVDYNERADGYRTDKDSKTDSSLDALASSPFVAVPYPKSTQPQSDGDDDASQLEKAHRSFSSVIRGLFQSTKESRSLPKPGPQKSAAKINSPSAPNEGIDGKVRAFDLDLAEAGSPSPKPKGAPARRGRKSGYSKVGGNSKGGHRPAENKPILKGRVTKPLAKKQKTPTKGRGAA